MDSILVSIKKLLGISEEDNSFDTEVILHINSAIAILTQLGVGPTEGFKISGSLETWMDFLGSLINIEEAKTQIYLRCRLSFDPPQNSFLIESIKDQLREFEWRMEVAMSLS